MWNPNLFGCNPRPNPSQLLRGEEAAEEGRNAAQQPSQQQPHFASVVEAFRLSPAVNWFGAMSLEQKSKQGGWLVLDIATCVCIWLEKLWILDDLSWNNVMIYYGKWRSNQGSGLINGQNLTDIFRLVSAIATISKSNIFFCALAMQPEGHAINTVCIRPFFQI